MTLYPNPSGVDNIYVNYNAFQNSPLTVKVFDLNGRLLKQKVEPSAIGEQTISIDITLLTMGSYIIHLDDGHRKGFHKLLVQ